MKDLRKLINRMGFEYEREEKAIKAIEAIFNLVASRDFNGMHKLTETKLGSAFLDIAEEYGANTEETMADWHWTEIDGSIIRYSRPFITSKDLDKEKNKNPITSQVENLLDEHYNETFK
jgi:hypothetical protein